MTKKSPLLPPGFYDLLPPDAAKEFQARAKLLSVFAAFGYEQVTPPLMEFETSLLAARGEDLSGQTFRVLDPLSQNMIGIRSDMTLQVGRIAASRLASKETLRLCYAGAILKSRPEPLRTERQLTQAGVELIGSDSLQADAEVIIIAAEALAALGIEDISIDINLPGLAGELCPEARNDAALRAKVKNAIQRKDTDMLASLPIVKGKLMATLINAAGPMEKALHALKGVKLAQIEEVKLLAKRIAKTCPKLSLTFDPMEYRGFDYHSGIGFSIFSRRLRHELGRGGRYMVGGEQATGFTIYVTYLLSLLPALKENKVVMIDEDAAATVIRKLHKEGWTTLHALTDNPRREAKKLGIKHIAEKGKIGKL
jgi:ATP phosphoribosyltransferase regulatory subunit